MPPDIIAGRYRVEREVGRGGMGSVWLCQDERLGRLVAVKQVGGLPGESSMHLARALREARHSAALNHANVVAIFDAVEEGDHVWLVMEYVPSRTLDEVVREDGPLAPAVAARIGADVADGLAAAHAQGTVHRDVKPSNILVRDDDGRALIADFGIARTTGQDQLTRSGLVTGTPAYFAPELARGEEPSAASDVWALGVSLYVAVEGHPPYAEHTNAIALLNTIASEPPPEAAGPLGPALRRMLDPDPAARWSMAQAAEELHALAAGEAPTAAAPPATAAATSVLPAAEPTPVRPAAPPPDTVPSAVRAPGQERRRRPALLALAALLLIALVGGGGWWLAHDSGDPAAGGSPSTPQSRSPKGKPASHSAQPSPSESSPSPTPPSTPSSPTSSSSPSAAPGGGSATAVVDDYYARLPEDTDGAWAMLTPDLQARIGRGSFDGFWATVDAVSVDHTEEVDDGVVQVTLTYTSDGRSEQETRQLEVSPAGDGLLISADDGAV